MEKEQRKLLLVAVSVGVFLLVTITAGIFLITNRTQQEASSPWSAPQPLQIQPSQPITETPAEISVNVDCEDSDITVAVDQNEGNRLIIQIPAPTAAAIPVNDNIPDTNVIAAAPRTTPAAPAETARTTSPPASRSTSASRVINDYWIQIGAFAARVRAEDAKDLLAEKGFISIIENSEVNGQVWYRVRLGPYTTQNEADYWLSLVTQIDGFGNSQIRQTTRTQ